METFSRILGTGSYLPEKILTNEELATIVETNDEWISKRVGVRQRHIIGESNDTTTSMAVEAGRRAIEAAGLTPDDIELIVVGTATPDYYFPSTACSVQKQLGIRNECPAFDVNAACSGFIYGLSIGDRYIKTGMKNVLVIGSESLTQLVDWQDRSTCVLFGDGAGAVVLGASEESGVLKTILHAEGAQDMAIHAQNPIWDPGKVVHLNMKGNEVFKSAVTKLGDIVEETLGAAGMTKADVDWLIPHQANLRIIQAMAKRLDLPMEQVILTIEGHGNTSAASVPLALDHGIRTGKIERGQTLLLEAFGAGLSWGAALITY